MTFYKGDYIKNISINENYKENWWYGECGGLGGYFPDSCILTTDSNTNGKPEEIDGSCDVRDEYGQTPLHLATLKGDCGEVSSLLLQGANINAQDKNGWTPLHSASRYFQNSILHAKFH